MTIVQVKNLRKTYPLGKVLVEAVEDLLRKYPNPYLQQSTLIFGDDAEGSSIKDD